MKIHLLNVSARLQSLAIGTGLAISCAAASAQTLIDGFGNNPASRTSVFAKEAGFDATTISSVTLNADTGADNGSALSIRQFLDGTNSTNNTATYHYDFDGLLSGETYDFTNSSNTSFSVLSNTPVSEFNALRISLRDTDGNNHLLGDVAGNLTRNVWADNSLSNQSVSDIVGLTIELDRAGFGARNDDIILRFDNFEADGVTVVPEPGAYALIGGLLALGAVMLRRRRG